MVEPATPGRTGDELSQISNQETERERWLALKAYLHDGSYGQVFELNIINGKDYWYCNLCRSSVSGKVYNHQSGKKHNLILVSYRYKSTGQFTSPQASKNKADEDRSEEKAPGPIEVAPGEPAPPGLETEVESVIQIQERLDAYKASPLVGLEYVLELQDYYDSAAKYLCVLCNKKGDSGIVLSHVSGGNHVFKYVNLHFPSVRNALIPYMANQYQRNRQICLMKIAEAIERRFGRLKPMPVEVNEFEKNKTFYLKKITQSKHFQESPTLTFVEFVTKEELTKTYDEPPGRIELFSQTVTPHQQAAKRDPSPPVVPPPTRDESKQPRTASRGIQRAKLNQRAQYSQQKQENPVSQKRKSLSPVYSLSSSKLSNDLEPDKRDKMDRQGKRRPLLLSRRSSSSSRSRSRSPRRSRSPERGVAGARDRSVRRESGSRSWERSDYVTKPKVVSENTQQNKQDNEMNEKMERFKKLAKAIELDMERVLKQHEANPEKHPQYNQEWKMFWNNRYKELQLEGKDTSKHNYIVEWIPFWNKRMKEIHDEEVKNKKAALQKRLDIPEQVTPIKVRCEVSSEPVERNRDKNSSVPHRPTSPESCPDSDPDNKDDYRKYKRSRSPARPHGDGEPAYKQRKDTGKDQSPWGMKRSYKKESVGRASAERLDIREQVTPIKARFEGSSEPVERNRDKNSSVPHRPTSPESCPDSNPDNKDDYRKYKRSRSPARPRGNGEPAYKQSVRYQQGGRSKSPLEKPPYSHHQYYDQYKPPKKLQYEPPKKMQDATCKPVILRSSGEDDDSNINIMGVLRLLAAFEERLGSLGPKVNNLLAEALVMEKAEANSSEKLLDSEINCVLLETVNEKLKGLILAGLIDDIQEPVYKRAIKVTENLIHLVSTRKAEASLNTKPDPVKVPDIQEPAYKRAIKKTENPIHLVSTRKAEASLNTKPDPVKVPNIQKPVYKRVIEETENLMNLVSTRKNEASLNTKPDPVKVPNIQEPVYKRVIEETENLMNLVSTRKNEASLNTKPDPVKVLNIQEPVYKRVIEETENLMNLVSTRKNEASLNTKPDTVKVPNIQEPVYKRAIKETENLMNLVSTRKNKASLNTNPDTVKVPDIGSVDKAAIARSLHYQQGGQPTSPLEKPSYSHHQYYDQYEPPKKIQKATREPVILQSDGEDDDSNINIIQVLRLLTAFEEKLGSLGPKVNNLLAQALVMEKAEANSSEKLLDKQINCVLLETVNEKLKGLILAGLVDNIQEPAYKRAIKKTASLIHLVSTRKTERSLNTKPDPVKMPNVGTTDTDAIAKQVANMLLMQGKTNVTQQQLAPLMNAMLKMAEASQNLDKVLTTGDFLNGVSETQKEKGEDNGKSPMDTVTLIANLLSNRSKPTSNSLCKTQTPQSAADFTKTSSSLLINPGCDKPEPGFNRQAPAFDRPPAAFGTPSLAFDRQGSGLNRPAPSFDRPAPSFDRPAPSFDRSAPSFDRSAPAFARPPPGFDKPPPGFDKPPPGFDMPPPSYDRSAPAFNRPSASIGLPWEGFDRTAPGFDRPDPGPESPNVRSCSESDRPGTRLYPAKRDQMDVERNPKKYDVFDIPGPQGLDKESPHYSQGRDVTGQASGNLGFNDGYSRKTSGYTNR